MKNIKLAIEYTDSKKRYIIRVQGYDASGIYLKQIYLEEIVIFDIWLNKEIRDIAKAIRNQILTKIANGKTISKIHKECGWKYFYIEHPTFNNRDEANKFIKEFLEYGRKGEKTIKTLRFIKNTKF